MAYDDNNPDRLDTLSTVPTDRAGFKAHVGRHHFARCGEWRPIMGNRLCPRCQGKCPGCGAYYVTPKDPTP